MVLDSAFSNLFDLMMELVDVYKIRLPKFTVKMAVHYMRRVIQKKAKFDIMYLDCNQVAPKTFIPALFGHATEDAFIQPHHSDLIFNAYAGDKNIIKFEGDHNSPRPQFYYDSVSIFFYNVLQPPHISSPFLSKLVKHCDLDGLKVGAGMDENALYEIITGLSMAGGDAASSSPAPHCVSNVTTPRSVGELLSETGAFMPITNAMESIRKNNMVSEMDGNDRDGPSHLQAPVEGGGVPNTNSSREKGVWENVCDPYRSLTSASSEEGTVVAGDPLLCVADNRKAIAFIDSRVEVEGTLANNCRFSKENWFYLLLGSKEIVDLANYLLSTFGCWDKTKNKKVQVLATPLRTIQVLSTEPQTPEKKNAPATRKLKREKLEALSQHLRLCFRKHVSHRRHQSS